MAQPTKNSLNRFQEVDQNAYNYVLKLGLREHPVLAELRDETLNLPGAQMQIGPDQGQFMRLLVEIMNAKNILEVGTYTGYSALTMALGMPKGGKLITCDIDPKMTEVAKKYWQRADQQGRIELRLGPGLETLNQLLKSGGAGTFDIAFIDADKQSYPQYYELCLELLRPGGVILVDNVFMGSRAQQGTTSESNGKYVHELNLKIKDDTRVHLCTLAIGDGLTLAHKK